MADPTAAELQAIRAKVARIAKLSDGLVRLGVLRLGVDGLLAWIPGVGEIYSAGAGVYILAQGAKAGVGAPTLAACAALLLGRTTISAVPLAGPLAADLFTAHRWSAKLVLKAIDAKLAIDAPPARAVRGRRRWGWSGRARQAIRAA